jgi:hypothetical protein
MKHDDENARESAAGEIDFNLTINSFLCERFRAMPFFSIPVETIELITQIREQVVLYALRSGRQVASSRRSGTHLDEAVPPLCATLCCGVEAASVGPARNSYLAAHSKRPLRCHFAPLAL